MSFLSPNKEYKLDSNTHGEQRAFVQTGVFEKVTPMDIYPVQLLKSILANDIDEMEELGIYEVIEEDLALCEFVDVSKHEVQEILREGIELMRTSWEKESEVCSQKLGAFPILTSIFWLLTS